MRKDVHAPISTRSRRARLAAVLLAALGLSALAAPPAAAETATGRVTPSRDQYFAFLPIVDGQADVVLTWGKKSADLFLIMTCGEDEDELVWGISIALLDRLQRLSAGVLADDVCTIGVFSLSGSTKIQLNVSVASSEPVAKSSAALVPVDAATRPVLRELGERMKRELRGRTRRR